MKELPKTTAGVSFALARITEALLQLLPHVRIPTSRNVNMMHHTNDEFQTFTLSAPRETKKKEEN
jgi:hypothetical protein